MDGDFLPALPSQLLAEGRVSNVTTMILWCDADVQIHTPLNIVSEQDTSNFFTVCLPRLSNQSISDLLSSYSVTDFEHSPDTNLTREFFGCARIYQDVLMACQPIGYGKSLAARGNIVYLIDQGPKRHYLEFDLVSLGSLDLGQSTYLNLRTLLEICCTTTMSTVTLPTLQQRTIGLNNKKLDLGQH